MKEDYFDQPKHQFLHNLSPTQQIHSSPVNLSRLLQLTGPCIVTVYFTFHLITSKIETKSLRKDKKVSEDGPRDETKSQEARRAYYSSKRSEYSVY